VESSTNSAALTDAVYMF
jgi:hypothetical protein